MKNNQSGHFQETVRSINKTKQTFSVSYPLFFTVYNVHFVNVPGQPTCREQEAY